MLRNIASAEVAYSASPAAKGAYGSLQDLARAGKLDHRFHEPNPEIDGFTFQATVTREFFTIRATGPVASPEWNFYIREDAIVRLSDETPLSSR
ncbi:MAG: hypothetical protein KA419_01615 [Acidobacteria bacterium]|nr:hypothetical protein [Acidobacteriota bacterium]